jgi:hypothetical protein
MTSWNADQRRWLGALGVTVFERAVAAAAATPAPETDPAVNATHAALRAALERAAGGRNLAELLLDLPRIRASGAAKRALWPTLRALRRRG